MLTRQPIKNQCAAKLYWNRNIFGSDWNQLCILRNGGESNLQAREFNQRLNVMLNCCKFIWRGLQVPNMDLNPHIFLIQFQKLTTWKKNILLNVNKLNKLDYSPHLQITLKERFPLYSTNIFLRVVHSCEALLTDMFQFLTYQEIWWDYFCDIVVIYDLFQCCNIRGQDEIKSLVYDRSNQE